MSIADNVKEIAVNIFKSVLKVSANKGGTFRILITADVEGNEKPLLIVGNAHASFEDGHCIAVLNPDEEVVNEIKGGVAYLGDILKNKVQGRCDLMLELWIDAYKEDGVSIIKKYESQKDRESKFKIT